jgi:hypothetical protein
MHNYHDSKPCGISRDSADTQVAFNHNGKSTQFLSEDSVMSLLPPSPDQEHLLWSRGPCASDEKGLDKLLWVASESPKGSSSTKDSH